MKFQIDPLIPLRYPLPLRDIPQTPPLAVIQQPKPPPKKASDSLEALVRQLFVVVAPHHYTQEFRIQEYRIL